MNTYQKLLTGLACLILIWSIWAGYAWQMFPAYLALGLSVLMLFLNKKAKRKIFSVASILLLLLFSILLWYIFPIIHFPKPSGPYSVGVHYQKLETQRLETFSAEEEDYRELYLKIWYPAKEHIDRSPNAYIEGGGEALTKMAQRVDLQLPTFLFSHLVKTQTYSYTEAPFANGQFPLITFSHGFGSWFGQNTPLMAELASRGFIVVAIGHSHQTMFTAKDDHTITTYPRIVPWAPAEEDSLTDIRQSRLHQLSDTAEYRQTFFEILASAPSTNANLGIWATDVREVLDMVLEQGSTSGTFFFGKIDTSKIGALGMSFGGGTAVEVAYLDSRVKAAVDLDGFNYGTWWKDTLQVPVVFLEAPYNPYYYSRHAPLKHQTTQGYYRFMFEGAKHYNFTDANLYSPIFRQLGLLGEVDGMFMIRTMNTLVPDFFESVLNGQEFDAKKYYIEGTIVEPKY